MIEPCTLVLKDGKPDWCISGCERFHNAHYRQYALDPGEKGQKFRRYWRQAAAQPPGIVQRAINYAAAVTRYNRNRGWVLPLELAEPRAAICHACEKYDATQDRCQHRKCGCTIAKKVTWSTESCPLNKWQVISGPAPAPAPAVDC